MRTPVARFVIGCCNACTTRLATSIARPGLSTSGSSSRISSTPYSAKRSRGRSIPQMRWQTVVSAAFAESRPASAAVRSLRRSSMKNTAKPADFGSRLAAPVPASQISRCSRASSVSASH